MDFFPLIKGDVTKCISVFLLLAHLISFISFVFVTLVFEEHFHVNYILKYDFPSVATWNIDKITLLQFPFHEITEIKPVQLSLTSRLSKICFLHLSLTNCVESNLISKMPSNPTSWQSQCLESLTPFIWLNMEENISLYPFGLEILPPVSKILPLIATWSHPHEVCVHHIHQASLWLG